MGAEESNSHKRAAKLAGKEVKRLKAVLQQEETRHLRAVNDDGILADKIGALTSERDRLMADNARLRGERNQARLSKSKLQSDIEAASTMI